jgi:predicted PurR-regulated permease PerM
VVAPGTVTQKSLQVGVGILALGAAITLLYYGRVFFITVIIASMIAFLLDPLVVVFMRLRLPRGLASFVVCSIGLLFLYLAGLGLYMEGLSIVDDLPAYGQRINQLVDAGAARMERFENGIYQAVMPKRLQDQPPAVQSESQDFSPPVKGKKKRADPPPPPSAPASTS